MIIGIPASPRAWWRSVRTGQRPGDAPPPAEFTAPGPFQVELLDAGERPIDVAKALREVTVHGHPEAMRLATQVPSTVAVGLSAESAQKVSERVRRAGATSVVSS